MSNPLKKLIGQTAVYGIPTIVGRLLNYLLVPLYTYTFLPHEYGVVTELYAYVAFLMVLVTYGMETAFFRFAKKHENNPLVFDTAQWSLIVSSLLFALIVWVFSGNIAGVIGYTDHPEYIVWFGLILAADAMCAIPFANLRNRNKAGRFALVKIANISINIGFNLFFILLCPYLLKQNPDSAIALIYNPSIGIGYIFISNLLASICTLLLLSPEFMHLQFRFDKIMWKQMMIYALPVMVWGMAGIVNETFDRVLLKYLITDKSIAMAQLGIYGACYKISIIMSLFIQAFRFAAEPFFFQHSTDKDARQTYAKVMKFFVIVCAFIFLGSVMFLDDLMKFVGPAFREGVGVVPILLMANLFLGVFYNLSIWYKLTDQTMFGAYISVAGAVLTLVLNFALVPSMGYMGAAWATFICYFFIAAVSYFLGQKYYPIPYQVKRIVLYLLMVVALYGIKIMLDIPSGIMSRTIGILFVGIFVAVVYLLEFKNKKLI